MRVKTFIWVSIVVILAGLYFFPNHSFKKDYEHAATLKEPYKAYVYLKDVELNYETEKDDTLRGDKAREMLLNQLNYLESAIDKGDKDAIKVLYEYPDSAFDAPYFGKAIESKVESLRKKRLELAPKVLELAKTSNEPSTLITAASILDLGEYTTRDVLTASTYLASAWALGDANAANKVALIYRSIKDSKNAYLWSLRCIRECSRDTMIRLDDLEKQLSAEQSIKIQKLAIDKSILRITQG